MAPAQRTAAVSIELEPCTFCGGHGMQTADKMATWIYCARCFARGPAVAVSRTDSEAQARAAWNSGKRFGKIGVTAVPAGLPPSAASVAKRLQMVQEAILAGDYGGVDAGVIILRAGKQAHTITHRIGNAETMAVLNAVRDAARVRASVTLPTIKGS